MPSVERRLENINLKINRARRHFDEFKFILRQYFDSKPFAVDHRKHPDGHGLIYVVTKATPTPANLPAVIGDVLQCLVTALDHLAYQLVCSNSNDHPPHRERIYFPILRNKHEYDKEKKGKLPGIDARALAAIDALQPYKGGNSRLFDLYQLNRIEKHRTLLTVGSASGGVDVFDHSNELLINSPHTPEEWHNALRELKGSMRIWATGGEKIPLVEGDVLYADLTTDQPSAKLKFTFGVGVSEAGVATHPDIGRLQEEFISEVEKTVDLLKHFLRDTPDSPIQIASSAPFTTVSTSYGCSGSGTDMPQDSAAPGPKG